MGRTEMHQAIEQADEIAAPLADPATALVGVLPALAHALN